MNLTPTKDFNLYNASILAKCSALAYQTDDKLFLEEISKLGLTPFSKFLATNTNCFYFIAYTDTCIVLSIRGTVFKSIQNWIEDAKIDQIPYTYGKGFVHKGFYYCVRSYYHVLTGMLRNLDKPLPIFVTGHSLGAAEAVIVTDMLAKDGFNVVCGYTYGCPRVGDGDFADDYKQTLYRFVNDVDLVPNLPSAISYEFPFKFEHFQHVGILEQINEQGKLVEGVTMWSTYWAILGSQIKGMRSWNAIIADHNADKYVAILDKLLEV
jgi:hypothetical protein